MKLSDVSSVDTMINLQWILLVIGAVLLLFLVISCGSLLPVWMFINTLQLISHVPMIRTELPGHAHYFLVE